MRLLLSLLATFLLSIGVAAQSWNPIVNLNVTGYCDSHDRCVYRTNSGVLYVLVNASPITSGASSLRMYKSTALDPTSLSEVDAAHHPTDSSRFIGADGRLNTSTGIVSIAYEPTATVTANYITFNTATDLWGSSELIANLSGQDDLRYLSKVALALDSNGIPHVTVGGANQGFFYTNRIGGTWGSSTSLTSNSNDRHPSLVFDLSGTLHLTWMQSDSPRKMLYRNCTTCVSNTINWSATETVDASVGTVGDQVDQSPSIALDSSSLPIILYHEQANTAATVIVKRRTSANTYSDVSPPSGAAGHDWSIANLWDGRWVICGHNMATPVEPACLTRSAAGTWGSPTVIATGVARDGSTTIRYDPLYPGTTTTVDVQGSDENSPPDDWFYNGDIIGQSTQAITWSGSTRISGNTVIK